MLVTGSRPTSPTHWRCAACPKIIPQNQISITESPVRIAVKLYAINPIMDALIASKLAQRRGKIIIHNDGLKLSKEAAKKQIIKNAGVYTNES